MRKSNFLLFVAVGVLGTLLLFYSFFDLTVHNMDSTLLEAQSKIKMKITERVNFACDNAELIENIYKGENVSSKLFKIKKNMPVRQDSMNQFVSVNEQLNMAIHIKDKDVPDSKTLTIQEENLVSSLINKDTEIIMDINEYDEAVRYRNRFIHASVIFVPFIPIWKK